MGEAMSAPLWTLDAVRTATGSRLLGYPPAEISGISIDSRTVGAGEAFFAIKGDRLDGHAFVADALKRGAAFAVVAEARLGEMPAGAALLVVADPLEALRALARAARARSQAKIVAITGSVGKTGTKEALRAALAREGETHASLASFNNQWGVPLSLARLPESARFAVFELGMNHAGEIEPLARLVRSHAALITAVEAVHLQFFRTVEEIADAKAEIFRGVEPGGAAVLPRDNPHFERLESAARAAGIKRIVGFGAHEQAEARLIDAAIKPDASTVRARILGDDITYKIGTPGRHLVENSLAVLAAAKLVGADLAQAALALAALQPPPGRGRRIALELPQGAALLIDESYNANPASMRAALEVLGNAPIGSRGRRIAVLGDMLELGAEGARLHRELAPAIEAGRVDIVYCAGPLMRALWDVLPAARRGGYAESAAQLESDVVGALRAGDAVMVKGSNGSRMGGIVKALADKFRARQTADAPA
jgi:UDP-N-acetylmuramoyl-tripeptide--D-alanyl-D-alanine ligase